MQETITVEKDDGADAVMALSSGSTEPFLLPKQCRGAFVQVFDTASRTVQ